MTRSIISAVTATLLTVLLAAAAQAAISPKQKPATQGPIEFLNRKCNKSTSIAGSVRLCTFWYRVQPSQDGTASHDYVIPWFQVKMEPARGWCATKVRGRFRFTAGMGIQAKAPNRKVIKTSRTKRMTSKLGVKAGVGERIGTVRKGFRLRRGKLVTTARNRDQGPSLKSTWTGRSKGAVGLAFGAELGFAVPQIQPGTAGRASFRARRC